MPRCWRASSGHRWAQAPTGDTTRHRGHGRAEIRTVKAPSVQGLAFPHAAQAVRIRRHVTDLRTGKVSWTLAYAVTSLEAEQAGAARLGALVRGHWAIEALHHIRDTTFAEDACTVRTGHGPANLAALRSLPALLFTALKRPTVPDAIRWVSYECFPRPLDLIGLSRPAITDFESALGGPQVPEACVRFGWWNG